MSRYKDAVVTEFHLSALRQEEALSQEAHLEALRWLSPPPDLSAWRHFLRALLLFLGLGLTVAGVIFFFAYNWQGLHRFAKLGLLHTSILGCLVFAWVRGLDELSSRAVLLVAFVLVGPLLGVFGQIYQTGADPYQLFFGWAGLGLVWVLWSRLPAAWFLWTIVLGVGLSRYVWVDFVWWNNYEKIFLAPAILFIIAWGIGEWLGTVKRDPMWQTTGRWWPHTQSALALCLLCAASCIALFHRTPTPTLGFCVALLCLVSVATFFFYVLGKRDLFMPTMMLLCLIVFSSFALGRIMFEEAGGDDIFVVFFTLGAWVIVSTGLSLWWLSHLNRKIEPSTVEVDPVLEGEPTEGLQVEEWEEPPVLVWETLIERLQQKSLLQNEDEDAFGAALDEVLIAVPPVETPWFFGFLAGLGGWLASLFFFAFCALFLSKISTFIPIGLFLVATAVAIRIAHRDRPEGALSIFLNQTALVWVSVGQFLIFVSLSKELSFFSASRSYLPDFQEQLLFMTVVMVLLQLILIVAYPDPLQRMLSVIYIAALVGLCSLEIDPSGFYGIIAFFGVGFVAMWLWKERIQLSPRWQEAVEPVHTGLFGGLFFCAGLFTLPGKLHAGKLPQPWIIGLVLTGLWVFAFLARLLPSITPKQAQKAVQADNLPVVAIVLVLLFGAASCFVPAVVVAGMVMTLGYARRHQVWVRVSILYLIVALSFFYYNLETSLLLKSMTMAGPGVLLLLARGFLPKTKATSVEVTHAV